MRRIGSGGFGQVWEAVQGSLGRSVALKLLRPGLLDSHRAQVTLEREARAAANLSHPGIVKVLLIGEDDGVTYVAQELVRDGVDLRDWVREQRESGVGEDHFERAASWIADVADALQSAHDAGVLHRDLKPSNIVIDSEGRPVVVDFGLAGLLSENTGELTGDLLGSPSYLAPEQVGHRQMGKDTLTDIYQLGATLYELLTLQPAIRGEHMAQQLHAIVEGRFDKPSVVEPRVPRDLERVCLRAMAREPGQRFATMAEFRDALRMCGTQPRTVSRGRRRGVGALVGLAIVTIVGVWLARDGEPGPGVTGRAEGPGFRGSDLLLVLDTSGSMDVHDPEGACRSAAQLLVDLLPVGSGVGLVSFASEVGASVALEPRLSSGVFQAIEGLRNGGKTDFVAALSEAERLLAAGGGSRRAIVVLASDGSHNPQQGLMAQAPSGDHAEILWLADALADRGARIFTLGLSDDCDRELMFDIAIHGGGSFHFAATPRDLLPAAVSIAEDAFGLFRHELKQGDRLPAPPWDAEMMIVRIGDDTGDFVPWITQDGVARGSGRGEARSRRGYGLRRFESGSLAGDWTVEIDTPPGTVALCRPGLVLERMQLPSKARLEVGTSLPLGLTLECGTATRARDVGEWLEVSAHVATEPWLTGGADAMPPVVLGSHRIGSTAAFVGSLDVRRVARAADPQRDEAQRIGLIARARDSAWSHRSDRHCWISGVNPPVLGVDEPGRLSASLARRSEQGWVRLEPLFVVTLDASRPLPVDARLQWIRGTEATFGSDGDSLEAPFATPRLRVSGHAGVLPGTPTVLPLELRVADDLSVDTYTGRLILDVTDGGHAAEVTLDFTLDLTD